MGEFLGGTIIFFYVLTILKYVFKWISRIFDKLIKKNESFYNIYKKVSLFFAKNHRIFGILTFLAVITHFIVQFSTIGLSITGLIAALIMMLQVSLGIYGVKVKNKWKYWVLVHRIIAFIILIAVIIHIAL